MIRNMLYEAPRVETDAARPTGSLEEEALARLAASQALRNAPICRSLLSFLWQHRGEAISEYAVGTLAMNRRADFDPKIDATVRVHVARLRNKLREYYEKEDPEAVIRFAIPLGQHQIEVTHLKSASPVEPRKWGIRRVPRVGPDHGRRRGGLGPDVQLDIVFRAWHPEPRP